MSKSKVTIAESEWSHFYNIHEMEGNRQVLSISPDPEEARRLALRLSVLSVDTLAADLVIMHSPGDVSYQVKGKFKAHLTQACAVTLEPVKTHIQDEFEAWFADSQGVAPFAKLKRERQMQKAHEELPILEEKEDPEAIVDGKIDLGELVTQYLSLSIDPYIRAEGVMLEVKEPKKPDQEPDLIKNPFAALKDWKARQGSEDH
jgi:uncharacterized metal-binding protein YceD (DUF177 family)